jgi:hypothetical protein
LNTRKRRKKEGEELLGGDALCCGEDEDEDEVFIGEVNKVRKGGDREDRRERHRSMQSYILPRAGTHPARPRDG